LTLQDKYAEAAVSGFVEGLGLELKKKAVRWLSLPSMHCIHDFHQELGATLPSFNSGANSLPLDIADSAKPAELHAVGDPLSSLAHC
jgi:hypothetical protein